MRLQDFAANWRLYFRPDLTARFGSKIQFTVASSPSDTTPPTLFSFDYTPKFINTTEGFQFVTVRVQADDDLSGLLFGPTTPLASFFESGINFRSPSGQQVRGYCCSTWTLVGGTPLNGTWEAQVFFPRFSEEGTWKVFQLQIKDAVRNMAHFNAADLEARMLPTELVVIKPGRRVRRIRPEPGPGEERSRTTSSVSARKWWRRRGC
ncbi:MAG: hypothetical protein IPM24_28480 [Bryobacterales bacterium]|nr:hypothetical protein [Bryobacterales bacterium]